MSRVCAVLFCIALMCHCQGILVLSGAKAEHARHASMLQTRLRDWGVEFHSCSDADVSPNDLQSISVVLLPLNGKLPENARKALAPYMAGGGKVLAFYDSDASVLKHLGISKIKYNLYKQGTIQGVSFDNGTELTASFPAKAPCRTNSVMAPTLLPGTLTIGHWLDAGGKPIGIAATLNKNGIYFCGTCLDLDTANGNDFLMAALAIYAPHVLRQYATKLRKESLSFLGKDTISQLKTRIKNCQRKGLNEILSQARAAKDRADALYNGKRFSEAVKDYRKAAELEKQVFIESAMSRTGELRGVWCHSAYGVPGYSWDEVVRALSVNGFNALFLNACWADLADYPSKVLLNAQGVAEKGDQIELCLKACRKYGVELHIWRVCWNLGHRYPADKLAAMQAAGRTQRAANGDDSAFLAPHVRKNLLLELDAIEEIAKKYKVDGIHLDYIRYSSSRFDYSDGARRAFEAHIGKKLESWPGDCQIGGSMFQEFCVWRCANISNLVMEARKRMKKASPKVKLSVAVYPEWENSTEWIGQDVRTWIDNGWVDFVCPMDYTADMNEYADWLQSQLEYNRNKVPLFTGIGLYKLKDNASALRQIEMSRKLGHDGFVCFDLKKGFLEGLLPQLGKGACNGNSGALPHWAEVRAFHVPDGEHILDGAFRQGATIVTNVELPRKYCNEMLQVSVESNGVDRGARGVSAKFTQAGLQVALHAEQAGHYRLKIGNKAFVSRSPVIRVLSPMEVKEQMRRNGPPEFSGNGGIKVGVWHENAYGAQPILDALSSRKGFDAAVLHNTKPENLAACQVLVIPQVRRRTELFKKEETADALRRFVRNGGGLLLTHAMVGTRSFPNLFPDVVAKVNQAPLNERNWRFSKAARNGKFSQSSFVDMIEMTPGKAGTAFLESQGEKCTMVVGPVNKGKYAACGLGLGIGGGDRDTDLSAQEKELLFKTVEWLAK